MAAQLGCGPCMLNKVMARSLVPPLAHPRAERVSGNAHSDMALCQQCYCTAVPCITQMDPLNEPGDTGTLLVHLHMPIRAALWCPMARPVVSRPKTRKGCARAWYATSFLMGSGMKYLTCANTCAHAQGAASVTSVAAWLWGHQGLNSSWWLPNAPAGAA